MSSGYLLGTLHYAAPEQINGAKVDRRTDVYSLGCVVYECLTGEVPYRRKSEVAVIDAHRFDTPPALHAKRPDLGEALSLVITTALAKDPEDRYTTCGELTAAMRRGVETGAYAGPAPIRRPRSQPQSGRFDLRLVPMWAWAVAGVMVGAALLVTTFLIASAVMG